MRHQLLKKGKEEGNYYTYGMPSMETFLKLRNGYNKAKGFDSDENSGTVIFFKIFMTCCGSRHIYSDKYHSSNISELYTPSQEGFVLIELMNNYDKWISAAKNLYDNINEESMDKVVVGNEQQEEINEIEEHEKNNEKDKFTSRGTLYTNSRFYSSMDGWSEQGIIEFNRLCHMAEKDRNTEKGREFESLFKSEEKRKKDAKGDHSHVQGDDIIVPYNNMLDDDDEDDQDNDDDDDGNDDDGNDDDDDDDDTRLEDIEDNHEDNEFFETTSRLQVERNMVAV